MNYKEPISDLTCCRGSDLKPAMSCITFEITETRETAVRANRKIITKGYPRIRRHIGVFRAASSVFRFCVASASDACSNCRVMRSCLSLVEVEIVLKSLYDYNNSWFTL